MVPRTTPAARPALDHEWLKASPFLVAHQTPDQDSLPKSYLESDTGPFGNPPLSTDPSIWGFRPPPITLQTEGLRQLVH